MQHSIFGTYLSGKLLCFILCRNRKVILPRDNVNWRAKVYFHSPFPLTSLQPSHTLLFCKNKILVGLVRYFQAYLPPTLLPWKPSQKRVGAGGVGAVWAAFQTQCSRSPAEEDPGAPGSCWNFSQCQRGRKSPVGRCWPSPGIPRCWGCDPERSGRLPTLLPGTLQCSAIRSRSPSPHASTGLEHGKLLHGLCWHTNL